MKKQTLWIFLLVTLLGYCQSGWSVPKDVTYYVELYYDMSIPDESKRFVKRKFVIERKNADGTVETLDKTATLLLNGTYPVQINNTRESIAGQTYYTAFHLTGDKFLHLKRTGSHFDKKLSHEHPITINNAVIFSNLTGTTGVSYGGESDKDKCTAVQFDAYNSANITNKPEDNCIARGDSALLPSKTLITGNIRFVFDYLKNLKGFLNETSTPYGLYPFNVAYSGDSIVAGFKPDLDEPVTTPEKYTFDFKIYKVEKLEAKRLDGFIWNGGDKVNIKTHTTNNDDDTDTVHVHGRKLFSVSGAFNPLSTLAFHLQSSPRRITQGSSSSFSSVNNQAITQAIPYQMHVTDLNSGADFPLQNGQNAKIKVSHSNRFNGALDFDFDVPCKAFTGLNAGLPHPLPIRHGHDVKIKASPDNQLKRTDTLDLHFNVQCGNKLLTFENSLIADVALKNAK